MAELVGRGGFAKRREAVADAEAVRTADPIGMPDFEILKASDGTYGWKAVEFVGEDVTEGEPDGEPEGTRETEPVPEWVQVPEGMVGTHTDPETGETFPTGIVAIAEPVPTGEVVAFVSPEVADAFGMGNMGDLVVIDGGYADPLTAPMAPEPSTAEREPAPGDVIVTVGIRMSRTEAGFVAHAIGKATHGLSVRLLDADDFHVVEVIDAKASKVRGGGRPASTGGGSRAPVVEFDYDTCPTDKYRQGLFNKLFAARGDYEALVALDTASLRATQQSQAKKCVRYLDWLLDLARPDWEAAQAALDSEYGRLAAD